MTDDTFGFLASRRTTAERLRDITPSKESDKPAELQRVDAVGEKLGFIQREGPRTLSPRRRREIGPTVAINMRVPQLVAERFVRFCEDRRMSYWEGVEELMKISGIKEGNE